MVTGDFNLGLLEAWGPEIITKLVNSTSDRQSADKAVASDKLQALTLLDFADKWALTQTVENTTREKNILDLVLVNKCNLVSDIQHEKYVNITDHDILIVKLDIQVEDDKAQMKNNFASTKIPEFNTDSMNEETIRQAKVFLENREMTKIDVT